MALPITLLLVVKDSQASMRVTAVAGNLREALSQAADKSELQPSLVFIAYLLVTVGITYLVGQLVALPLFVIAYLLVWGGYRPRDAAIYALMTSFIIWGFYGELMNLLFHPSLFFSG